MGESATLERAFTCNCPRRLLARIAVRLATHSSTDNMIRDGGDTHQICCCMSSLWTLSGAAAIPDRTRTKGGSLNLPGTGNSQCTESGHRKITAGQYRGDKRRRHQATSRGTQPPTQIGADKPLSPTTEKAHRYQHLFRSTKGRPLYSELNSSKTRAHRLVLQPQKRHTGTTPSLRFGPLKAAHCTVNWTPVKPDRSPPTLICKLAVNTLSSRSSTSFSADLLTANATAGNHWSPGGSLPSLADSCGSAALSVGFSSSDS